MGIGIVDCIWNMILKGLAIVCHETNGYCPSIQRVCYAMGCLNRGLLDPKRSNKLTPIIAYYASSRVVNDKGYPIGIERVT